MMSARTSTDRLTAQGLASFLAVGITAAITILGAVPWWTEQREPTDHWTRLVISLAIALLVGWIVAQRQVVTELAPRMRNTVWLWGVGGLLLCMVFIPVFGRMQFAGFDHSVLIDLGWRQFSGQRVFRDFPNTLPIGFVLGCKACFTIFGVSWAAILAWQLCFAGATFAWSFGILWRITRNAEESFILAFTVQAAGNLLTAFWWYNPATTTLACIFFLSAAWLFLEPYGLASGLSYTAALTLLAAMKPNVAGVLIISTTAILVTSPFLRQRVLVYSMCGFVAFVGTLALQGISALDVVRSYLSISSRGFVLRQFLQDMTKNEKAVALLLFSFACWPIAAYLWQTLSHARCPRKAAWLGLVATAAGSYGFLTNGESKLVDLPLILLGGWWLNNSDVGHAAGPGRWSRFVFGVCAFVCVLGVLVGAVRHRVQSAGPNLFFSNRFAMARPITPFFRCMRNSSIFSMTEIQVDRALREERPKNVYFGPRMQWAYAAFGIESPADQLVWWDPGVSCPLSDEAAWVKKWQAAKFDAVVLIENDRTRMPAALCDTIQSNYVRLLDYSPATYWKRKTTNQP